MPAAFLSVTVISAAFDPSILAIINEFILNIFPAVIDEIVPEGKAQVMVRLDMSGKILLACVTRKSATMLKLEVGINVFVQVKSVAIVS